MLGPPNGTIKRAKTLDLLCDSYSLVNEFDLALKMNLCQPKMCLHRELPICFANLVRNNSAFSVRRNSLRKLFVRRTTENVEAQIVPHDAGQQFRIVPAAVFRMFLRVVGRWLNRRPRRNPERIDGRSLIQNLSDVTAFLQYSHTEILILDEHSPPATIRGFGHAVYETRFALDKGPLLESGPPFGSIRYTASRPHYSRPVPHTRSHCRVFADFKTASVT